MVLVAIKEDDGDCTTHSSGKEDYTVPSTTTMFGPGLIEYQYLQPNNNKTTTTTVTITVATATQQQ
jgi:hypothetical protein